MRAALLFLAVVLTTVECSPTAAGQQVDDSEFLARAANQAVQYSEVFHDLTAHETMTIQTFNARGSVWPSRKIVSSLIIYRSQADAHRAVEYRDVEEVDGSAVKDHTKRAIKLLEGITDSKSAADELNRITTEASRYNQGAITVNMTLHEALPLLPECRHAFAFWFVGYDSTNNFKTRVYRYEQRQDCEASRYKLGLQDEYESGPKLHSGGLWLDDETGKLVREERRVFAESKKHPERKLKVLEATFDYAPSNFDIFVPSKISITSYRMKPFTTDQTIKDVTVTQAYGPFSRFEVNVEQKIDLPKQ